MEETPPPELKDRLLTGMPRRETRRVPLAAAAAILCALAVLGVLYYTGFFAPDEVASANLQATDLAPKAGGELRARRRPQRPPSWRSGAASAREGRILRAVVREEGGA